MSVNEVTFFETGRHAIVPGLLATLGQLIARYLAYRQRRADIATLHSMCDRELKDIGVYRHDVDRLVRQGRGGTIDAALRSRSVGGML
jgi:uncharacterized protein YjiS (DUF1127 family)